MKILNFLKKKLLTIKAIRLANYKRNKYRDYNYFNDLELKEDSIFIDIGGNIGQVSEFINDKFGCKIFIFEPHPGCLRVLKKKFSKCRNIKIIPEAVSNYTGKMKLFIHKDSKNLDDIKFSQGNSLEFKKKNIDKNRFITVKTININELLKKFKKIDLIKIDIECHEYKILPSIFKKRNKINKIFCELNGKKKYQYLRNEYTKTVNYLKNKNLYGSWFINWT